MEQWGANLYGNPCRECGFDWSLTPEQAVTVVRAVPGSYKAWLAGATGRERHPDLAWSATGYVCHVTDNLRIWAERLAGGYLAADLAIADYEPDLLSQGRRYDEVSLAGAAVARWAPPPGPRPRKRRSPSAWYFSTLLAAGSGPRTWPGTAHDTHHHRWDIGRITRANGVT